MKAQTVKILLLVVIITLAFYVARVMKERNDHCDVVSLPFNTVKDISEKDIYHFISVLASDSLEGRQAGTEAEKSASEFIRKIFLKNKISCFSNNYFQNFSFLDSHNCYECDFYFDDFKGIYGIDFCSAIALDSSSVTAEAVFVGYGQTDRYGPDDYAGIDAKNKWVILFEGTGFDKTVPKAEQSLWQRYQIAMQKGASGVLAVSFDLISTGDILPYCFSVPAHTMKKPMIRISGKTSDKLLKYGGITTLQALEKIKNKSWNKNIPVEIHGTVHSRQDSVYSRNVVACLKGKGKALKNEYIVVGAHYDHIGKIDFQREGRDSTIIFNGADDNASGVAGLLELTEKLSSSYLKRDIIFVAFGAEEKGLKGSNHFCYNLPVPAEQIKLMINLDMIGRLDSTNALYYNTDAWDGADTEIENTGRNHPGINTALDRNDMMGSDYVPFIKKKIPVVYFNTGAHSLYHTPNDTIGSINYSGEKKVLDLVYDLIISKANK